MRSRKIAEAAQIPNADRQLVSKNGINTDDSSLPSTARARVIRILTQEILASERSDSFPIASESQLCQRFGVSRITIILALNELENRGLIYRKQGRGTFAYGRSSRIYPHIAILNRSSDDLGTQLVYEAVRGALGVTIQIKGALTVLCTSPKEWQPDMARQLGGVIVTSNGILADDLQSLKDRSLPYVCVGFVIPGQPCIASKGKKLNLFNLGRLAAQVISQAAQTGEGTVTLINKLDHPYVLRTT